MKIIKAFLFALICFLPQIVDSQINPGINFYPLHVGDVWQYKITYQPPNYQTKTFYLSKRVLTDTLLTNGKRYFFVEQPPFIYDEIKNLERVFIRIDTISGIVYKYVSNKPEEKIDSLFSETGNRFFNGLICWGVYDAMVFGQLRRAKTIGGPTTTNGLDFNWHLAMDIGIYEQGIYFAIVAITGNGYELVYAKINGKEYGTLMSREEETEIPLSFQLSQNYPNPFNPITIIKYSIPKTSFVSLKIYDILGREIQSLVSEEKLAGSYEVIFDGRDLASGVYFYTLTAGKYSQAKKLVILK